MNLNAIKDQFTFGQWIQIGQVITGVTIKQIAYRCQVDPSVVSAWRNDLRRPRDWKQLAELAETVGIPTETLLRAK